MGLPPPSRAVEMPVDHLGLIVLGDMLASRAWNERNFVIEAQNDRNYDAQASRTFAEAIAWLKARGLIARDHDQHSADATFVTRIGRKVVEEGPDTSMRQSGYRGICTGESRRRRDHSSCSVS